MGVNNLPNNPFTFLIYFWLKSVMLCIVKIVENRILLHLGMKVRMVLYLIVSDVKLVHFAATRLPLRTGSTHDSLAIRRNHCWSATAKVGGSTASILRITALFT